MDKNTEEVAKKAMVAAANMAMDYLKKNPRANHRDALRFVIGNSNQIIEEVSF